MGIRPCHHFDDGAFRASASIGAGDARLDAVAIQYLLHLFFRQEDIGTGVIRDQETVAISMAAYAAFDKIGQVGQHEMAVAIGFDLTVTLHGVQAAG